MHEVISRQMKFLFIMSFFYFINIFIQLQIPIYMSEAFRLIEEQMALSGCVIIITSLLVIKFIFNWLSSSLMSIVKERIRHDFIIRTINCSKAKKRKNNFLAIIHEDIPFLSNYISSMPFVILDSVLFFMSLYYLLSQSLLVGGLSSISFLFVILFFYYAKDKYRKHFELCTHLNDSYKSSLLKHLKSKGVSIEFIESRLKLSVCHSKQYCWNTIKPKILLDIMFCLIIAMYILVNINSNIQSSQEFVKFLGFLLLVNMTTIRLVEMFSKFIGLNVAIKRVRGFINA